MQSSIPDARVPLLVPQEVEFTKTIRLENRTLPEVIAAAGLENIQFDALILDVQGAEDLVIKGAKELMRQFKYVKLEAADFDAYANACKLQDLEKLLQSLGYRMLRKHAFRHKPGVGTYFDVLFCRRQFTLHDKAARVIVDPRTIPS